MLVTLLYIFTVFAVVLSTSVAFLLEDCRNFLLRGGLVPQASNDGKYYEKFDIDYGCDDNVRMAGSMRGLIKAGKLTALESPDRFIRWLNKKLEYGAEPAAERVKPFFAADFGSKKDLKFGEHPKIMIVNRELEVDNSGKLKSGPTAGLDVEVREIWQPWLKSHCDFVVRYIVPNRANIIEIMEGQGRFRNELVVGMSAKGKKTATARMVFKPTCLDRLKGKRDVVITRELDVNKLFE